MRENQKPFEYEAPTAPPRGLFSRIIKRLGLEKQLRIVRKNLGLAVGITTALLVLLVFAVIGFGHVLAESSFGPFISLMFSDPGAVVKYWHSFILSVFESMPGIPIVSMLLVIAFLMLFMRLASVYLEKFVTLARSARKQLRSHVK